MKHLDESRACIQAYGGPEKMAEKLGLGVSTVRNWRTTGIPAKHSVDIQRRSRRRWMSDDLTSPPGKKKNGRSK